MRSDSRGARGGRLREIRPPFVVAAPSGARVRTRLRVSARDTAVLEALGSYLGRLAGGDLAARCAQGRLDAKERNESRRGPENAPARASASRGGRTTTPVPADARQVLCAGPE